MGLMFNRKKSISPQAAVEWRKAKQEHKVAIKKLRRDIKKHKMLRKQAKLVYKISKA